MKPIKQRFEEKYTVNRVTGCWDWHGSKNKKGYGHMGRPGSNRLIKAHRASYLIHNGYLPDDEFVCHRCDNPSCVNPNHLFLGSHKENMKDMTDKGRQAKGENCRTSKLTSGDVVSIRKEAASKTQAQLARDYGVSPGYVWGLLNNLYWKHV